MTKIFGHNKKDNMRTCAVCRMELQTNVEKIAPKRRGNLSANIRTSEDGVFFQLVNAWFCNECWKNVNRGLTTEDKELLEKERKRESLKLQESLNKRFEDMGSTDEELYNLLRNLRNEIAKEKKLPAYFILNNETLQLFAIKRPRTRDEIMEIKGVGNKNFDLYGDKFLSTIKEFISKNKIPEEVLRKKMPYHQKMDSIHEKYLNAYNSWEENEEQILLHLFDEGKSITEIAEILKRQIGGIRSRLIKLGRLK